MSIFFLFFIWSFPVLCVGLIDDCSPLRCNKHGPSIQPPFRHKYHHPQDCGYPGFDVYCDEQKETVLALPLSVKVIIQKIDYVHQQLDAFLPEKCLVKKLLHLNFSVSPFFTLFEQDTYPLFNCSASNGIPDELLIPCLGDSIYVVWCMEGWDLNSCVKYNDISLPDSILFGGNKLYLEWYEPQCGYCEAHGKRCSLKDYKRRHQIQCMDKPKTNHGVLNSRLLIAGAILGSILVMITFAALFFLYTTDKDNRKKIEKFLEDYRALQPTRFCYSDIRRITHQFSEKLGEGGFGTVYKGKLSNELYVAVKVLNNTAGNGEEFINEVSTIGSIHHVNVVHLIGFCAEGTRRALVYEYLPNDSLEKSIFQVDKNSLGWEKIQGIALGIAKGIEYLHQGCDQQILHFDIKPHNILLDHNLNPKICDFGLAKFCAKERSAVTMTAARGTMGYIAPEVLSRTFGKVSYKSDVYSFGMLLLEMVGGRKNVDDDDKVNSSQVNFPQWIYRHLNVAEDIWAKIEEVADRNIARKLTIVGLWCIQWHPSDRPSMKQVVQMIERDEEDNLTMPPNPFPDTNAANSIARIAARRYQAELPLIIESE